MYIRVIQREECLRFFIWVLVFILCTLEKNVLYKMTKSYPSLKSLKSVIKKNLFALFSDKPDVFHPKYSQTAILHAAHSRRVVNVGTYCC